MIKPVRAVGGSAQAVQYCALAAPLAVRLRLASLSRLYIPWHRLSLLIKRLDQSGQSKPTTPSAHPYINVSASTAAGTLPARLADRQQPFNLNPWQPWPAHEAFADEIKRWWPSEETPFDNETVIIEQLPRDLRPQLVLWPTNGGLLDTWI